VWLPAIIGCGLVAACNFPADDGANVGSKGLWVANGTNVVEYNPSQLGSGTSAPAPHVSINSAVFGSPQGVAFDPNYVETHRFYVDYTDRRGDTHVVQYRSDGVSAIPSSARQLLFVKDFASNHNGGQLQFGPDGLLYWGNGDGGGGGDPHQNGQNLNRPFAKIMRLDVNAPKPRWRLVAFGLRNPWRFSFDRKTGDLFIFTVPEASRL